MEIPLFDALPISKIFITGPLSPKMPYIVLRELALECSYLVNVNELENPIIYANVFKKLAKMNPPTITNLNLYQTTQIHSIQKYINPLSDWEPSILLQAYTHLNYFRNSYREPKVIPLPRLQDNLQIGLQTKDKIYSINACILYGVSVYLGIDSIPLDISYEDLRLKVLNHHYYSRPFYSTVEILSDNENDIDIEITSNTDTLESMDTVVPLDEENKKVDIDEIVFKIEVDITEQNKNFDFFQSINTIQGIADYFHEDMDYLRKYFQPLNNEQAIVCAAYNDNKDLSQYKCPIIEYNLYKFKNQGCEDLSMRLIANKNAFYDDLLMYFNPYLPYHAYNKEKNIIETHLKLFSYDTYEFIGLNAYEILQELHLKENFYLGWHPNIINQETPIELDAIDELNSEELVCFGTRQDSMKAITWKELYNLFKNTNLFVNPFEKNKLFHKHDIQRLIKLGNWVFDCPFEYKYLFVYNSETKEQIRKCVELAEYMLLLQKDEFNKLKSLASSYEEMDEANQKNIRKTIQQFLKLTMYMRGWKEDEPYPIESTPIVLYEETEKRVLEGIVKLDESNKKCNGFLYCLPLIIWKNEFVQSCIEEQGLTIGDRINIVKKGELEGISSCIRMTSNVFAATFCFYCKLFKMKEVFDIKDLIFIQ